MAVLASETWTGSNGAAWPAQWTGTLGSGATRTIQTNRGRLTPINSAWSGDARAYLDGMAATADVDIVVNALAPSPGNIYFAVAARCDGVPVDSFNPQTGYAVEFGEGNWTVKKHKDFARTDLGSGSYALSSTVATWMRFQVQGTALRFRAWQDGATEPTSWTWTGTDSEIATGKVWLAATNGETPSSVSFDSLTVSSIAGGTPPATETADCTVRIGGVLVPAVTRYRIGGVLVPARPV